jgi:hypothetical protein
MTLLSDAAVKELLREAARRGSVRANELLEHARETFATGPAARHTLASGFGVYFPNVLEDHVRAAKARYTSEHRSRKKIPTGRPVGRPKGSMSKSAP